MPLKHRETENWLRPGWSNISAPSDVVALHTHPHTKTHLAGVTLINDRVLCRHSSLHSRDVTAC
uniref:Uncharacterized protein n=1 Tax=Mesocestoides corti TaxID=53468 RepID=A0A5K3FWP6_MESCO